MEAGRCGVDIFFVISGFIMWLVTRNRETDATLFLKRRLLRIVPLYWLINIVVAIAATAKPNLFPVDRPEFSHVVQSMLFIPHTSPTGDMHPLIGQGWTLYYETFFYVLFAFTLAWFRQRQFLCLASAILCLVCLGAWIHFESQITMTYTSPLLLEFLAGAYIGRAWLAGWALPLRAALVAMFLGIICVSLPTHIFDGLARCVTLGIPASFIVAGLLSVERRSALPQARFLRLLGDASYSIYLTHYLAWLAVSLVVAKAGLPFSTPVYLVTVLAAVVLGIATYFCVEQPLSRGCTRLFGQRS